MHARPWVLDGVWAAGARVLTEPEETQHGRQCRVEDLEGHRWMFRQRA